MENFSVRNCVNTNPNESACLRKLFITTCEHSFEKTIQELAVDIVHHFCRSPGGLTGRSRLLNNATKRVIPKNNNLHRDADKTHIFLTHNWGDDLKGRSNHDRVARVNDELKRRGVVTWFDEDKMHGDTRRMMTDGIDNTSLILVFVTKEYRTKVRECEIYL